MAYREASPVVFPKSGAGCTLPFEQDSPRHARKSATRRAAPAWSFRGGSSRRRIAQAQPAHSAAGTALPAPGVAAGASRPGGNARGAAEKAVARGNFHLFFSLGQTNG